MEGVTLTQHSRHCHPACQTSYCALHVSSWVLQSPTVKPETWPELTALAHRLFWMEQARWVAADWLTKVSPLTSKGRSALPELVTAGAAMPPMALPEEADVEVEPDVALLLATAVAALAEAELDLEEDPEQDCFFFLPDLEVVAALLLAVVVLPVLPVLPVLSVPALLVVVLPVVPVLPVPALLVVVLPLPPTVK